MGKMQRGVQHQRSDMDEVDNSLGQGDKGGEWSHDDQNSLLNMLMCVPGNPWRDHLVFRHWLKTTSRNLELRSFWEMACTIGRNDVTPEFWANDYLRSPSGTIDEPRRTYSEPMLREIQYDRSTSGGVKTFHPPLPVYWSLAEGVFCGTYRLRSITDRSTGSRKWRISSWTFQNPSLELCPQKLRPLLPQCVIVPSWSQRTQQCTTLIVHAGVYLDKFSMISASTNSRPPVTPVLIPNHGSRLLIAMVETRWGNADRLVLNPGTLYPTDMQSPPTAGNNYPKEDNRLLQTLTPRRASDGQKIRPPRIGDHPSHLRPGAENIMYSLVLRPRCGRSSANYANGITTLNMDVSF